MPLNYAFCLQYATKIGANFHFAPIFNNSVSYGQIVMNFMPKKNVRGCYFLIYISNISE